MLASFSNYDIIRVFIFSTIFSFVKAIPLQNALYREQEVTKSDLSVLDTIRHSSTTIQLVSFFAVLPIALSMFSHLFIFLAHKLNRWAFFRLGIVFLLCSKFIAVPLGLFLLLTGVVTADLEISLVGVSSLAFIYSSQIGSWNGVGNLYLMLRWTPDLFQLHRWHIDRKGNPKTYAKNDSPQLVAYATRRLLLRACKDDADRLLLWRDELILATLALKFVSLTDAELEWREKRWSASVKELLFRISRWERGWNGRAGAWLREWTCYESIQFSSQLSVPLSESSSYYDFEDNSSTLDTEMRDTRLRLAFGFHNTRNNSNANTSNLDANTQANERLISSKAGNDIRRALQAGYYGKHAQPSQSLQPQAHDVDIPESTFTSTSKRQIVQGEPLSSSTASYDSVVPTQQQEQSKTVDTTQDESDSEQPLHSHSEVSSSDENPEQVKNAQETELLLDQISKKEFNGITDMSVTSTDKNIQTIAQKAGGDEQANQPGSDTSSDSALQKVPSSAGTFAREIARLRLRHEARNRVDSSSTQSVFQSPGLSSRRRVTFRPEVEIIKNPAEESLQQSESQNSAELHNLSSEKESSNEGSTTEHQENFSSKNEELERIVNCFSGVNTLNEELTEESFESLSAENATKLYELTLRFVIAVFECLDKGTLSSRNSRGQKLHDILSKERSEGADMKWFSDLVTDCLPRISLKRICSRATSNSSIKPF